MALKDAVQEIVNGLEWAIENRITQYTGDYVDPLDLYSKSSVKDCKLCAMGAIYVDMFGVLPKPAIDFDAVLEVEQKLYRKHKLTSEEFHTISMITYEIVEMNDEEELSFQDILDRIKRGYL